MCLICCESGVEDLSSQLASVLGLNLCHVNIVSLSKNFEKYRKPNMCIQNKLDVICISETSINPNNLKAVNITGYNFFCHNSEQVRRGWYLRS